MSAPRTNAEPNCLHCREPQPHPGAHFDGQEFVCSYALRKEPPAPHFSLQEREMTQAEADALDRIAAAPSPLEGVTLKRVPLQPPALPAEGGYHSCTEPGCKRCEKRPGEYCSDDECNCGAAGNHATLPALPAEVEAVVWAMEDEYCPMWHHNDRPESCPSCRGITLLRRYAQAVAEKDAEIATWMRACDACDGGTEWEPCYEAATQSFCPAHLKKHLAAEKKLQAVEALCARAEDGPGAIGIVRVTPFDIRKILREEH